MRLIHYTQKYSIKLSRYLICAGLLYVGSVSALSSDSSIVLYDLTYTLELDMTQESNIKNAWDHCHTVATLQGVVNRSGPNLYLLFIEDKGVNIDFYWWQKYRASGRWLDQRDTTVYSNLVDLIDHFSAEIQGAVVYDPKVPSTSNIASAVAGVDNLIAIRYDTDPESLYSLLVLNGPEIPVKKWLLNKDGSSLFTGEGMVPNTSRKSSGSAKNDAYLWFVENYIKKGKVNTAYGAYYIDQQWMENPRAARLNHHTLTNHDFFISNRAFFFDLSPWGDERATDDPDQKPGTDLQTLKELLELAYRQNDSGGRFTHIGGFPPWAFKYTKRVGGIHEDVATEWEYSKIISAYNAFKDADAIGYGALANASFWQHFPLKSEYPQKWITHRELEERGYLNSDGKLTIGDKNLFVFYVGDYDASSWLSQTTPSIWDNQDRGKVPLMWSISPVLADRVPMAMEYRRETATPNDYFVAADNGAGYLMPGMLQSPRPISQLPDGLDSWVDHNLPYYKQWDLSITGFIIDGEAPGLNKKGLDAYSKFSPNGIVPQKVPLTILHNNMPVLRSGQDVNDHDPAEAAKVIAQNIHDRKIPFHWYRNILKSPTWYVEVVEELKRIDPSIILLDAPSFFELYRIYLLENEQYAKGMIK